MTNSYKLKFLKGSLAASLGTVISIIFHFLSIMLLTRFLSKEDYGIYVLILVIVIIFTELTGLGLNLTLVKHIASVDISDKKGVFTAVLAMRIITLFLMIIIFYSSSHFIANFFDNRLDSFLFYIPILFFIDSFKDLFYNLLQGLNLFKKYAIIQISSAVSRIVIIYFFLTMKNITLNNLIYIEIFVNFFTIIVQVILIPIKNLDYSLPKYCDFKRVLNFSIPLYFNSIFTLLINRLNIIIIGTFLDPTSIAYYNVAEQIPQGLRKLFNSFLIVFFPHMSWLYSHEKNENAQNFMNKVLVAFSSGMVFLFVISFLYKEEIIILIFSNKYLPSANSFSLLLFSFYLGAITNIIGKSVIAAGHPSIPLKANIVSSSICILCSFLMIPKIGFIGAVYSAIIMNIISKLIHYFYSIKVGLIPNFNQYFKPVLFAIIIFCCYFFLKGEAIIIKIALLIVYLIFNLIFVDDLVKNLKSGISFLFHLVVNKREELFKNQN